MAKARGLLACGVNLARTLRHPVRYSVSSLARLSCLRLANAHLDTAEAARCSTTEDLLWQKCFDLPLDELSFARAPRR